jgi:hypothetical protein
MINHGKFELPTQCANLITFSLQFKYLIITAACNMGFFSNYSCEVFHHYHSYIVKS